MLDAAQRPVVTPVTSEREARIQLAACYRLIARFGMDDLIYTHVSARLPDDPDAFLINPYGMLFSQITASSLVKVDHAGAVIGESRYPVNTAGFVIHSAIHMARPDVGCVLHTHTRAGVAVACLAEGLLPINQFALEFDGRIAYHDYEGIATDLEERARLVRDLGDRAVMILRNHGLLTAAPTIPAAFYLMHYLEQSCRVQLDVMASGGRIVTPPAAVRTKTAGQYTSALEPALTGQRLWPALIALLDAEDPSYRD